MHNKEFLCPIIMMMEFAIYIDKVTRIRVVKADDADRCIGYAFTW